MAPEQTPFSEDACALAARIAASCGTRDADEFWRLIRQAQRLGAQTAPTL